MSPTLCGISETKGFRLAPNGAVTVRVPALAGGVYGFSHCRDTAVKWVTTKHYFFLSLLLAAPVQAKGEEGTSAYASEKSPSISASSIELSVSSISQQEIAYVAVLPTAGDHVYGNPDADVSIITYSAFNCPFCRHIHPVLRQFVNESSGSINWIFRVFPLSADESHWKVTIAAECVGERLGEPAYWRFINKLFVIPGSAAHSDEALIRLALKANGMNSRIVQECIKDADELKARIRQQRGRGVEWGVSATPTLVLVDRKSYQYHMIEGAAGLRQLREAVSELRKNQ